MSKLRNETLWLDIEDLPPFAEDAPGEDAELPLPWPHLEILQKGGRLNAIDVMHLKSLIEAVYEIGIHQGKQDAQI